MNYLNRRTGDRRIFAVEFEIELDQVRSPNEWYGCLWLWVDGRCVGESQEVEMVSIALEHLVAAAQETGSRSNRKLSSLPADEALNLVIWAAYGDDSLKLEQQLAESRQSLAKFDILPTSAGPFFDSWEATLIELGDEERFIYRRDGEAVREAKWRLGTFKDVVLQAQADFTKIVNMSQRPPDPMGRQ